MKRHRREAVVPVAVCYVLILLCLSLIGPLRFAKAYLQEVIEGSGKVVKENRQISQFDAVQVSGVGNLVATQGNSEALTIEAEDNIVPLVTSEVKERCLYIQVKPKTSIHPTKPIRYTLSLKQLNRLGLSGAVKAEVGKISTKTLNLAASGACKVDLAGVEASKLTTDVSGACTVNIAGRVDDQTVSLSGASNYQGDQLQSKTASVETSGASKAIVHVSDTLKAGASGVSKIQYKGKPTVSPTTSGLSVVKAASAE